MPVDILFVCTGNICRSPMAERLFLARLRTAGSDEVHVHSAGTNAVVGHGMDAPSAHVLRDLGGNPDGHAGRQLDDDLVRDADLILTASTNQRDTILRVEPGAMRKTFTMREFARLGRDLPPRRPGPPGARITRRIVEVAGRRGFSAPDHPGGDDIADPYGAGKDAARLAGEQVSAAVDATLRTLGLG